LVTAIAENITPAATCYPSAEVYQSASEHRSPRACLQTMSLNRNKRANSAKSDSMRDTVLQLTGTSGNPRPDTDTINPDCCRAKLCCLLLLRVRFLPSYVNVEVDWNKREAD
jgi:hypothetical protein